VAKDFAKSNKKRKSASRLDSKETGSSIQGWIWLVAGLLIGIFISTFLYIQYQTTETKPVTKVKTPTQSAKSRYKAVPAEEATESDFSFHNELENKTVEVPVEKSIPEKNTTHKNYIMQCGSFRNEASAETLRAQIAMNGFEANIKKTAEKSGQHWYRVVLGPYSSKRLAERHRHQLERNNINNCRIW